MFTQLYAKSCFSLMESTLSIETLVKTAKDLNYQGVCLSDKDVLHGALDFYYTCQKHQITPLIGLLIDVKLDELVFPISIIAKNQAGYQALMNCSFEISTSNDFIPYEKLLSYQNNCVIIIHSEKGIFESALLANDYNFIKDKLAFFKNSLNDFYLGLSNGESVFWRNLNNELEKIAFKENVSVVALPKVSFKDEQDETTLKVLKAIKTNSKLSDLTLKVNGGNHFYNLEKLNEFYSKNALDNTNQILKKCHFELEKRETLLPIFNPEINSNDYLKELCFLGLKKRFNDNNIEHKYLTRLNYELSVINKMNYADYFLIVWDFILFARKQNIYVGPGRGSSAGSLVAYCLGITHVDPLKYGLLFERFLNPERISMPDIDVDFPDNRRQEVIDYVVSRYGTSKVAHIITFGTFGARQAIRDVGRVLDFSTNEIDILSKLIPNKIGITLTQAFNENKRLQEIINNDKRYLNLYQLANKLEGLPRHISMHAAGIVLSEKDLLETVPLMKLDDNNYVTQFSMEYLEELGLIKIDFLGLRNLTIIDEVLKLLESPIDILKIPLDDLKTYKLLQDVMTLGIFQLESHGMRNLLQQLKPHQFTDLVVAIALFRPGPMENIGNYLKARNQPESVVYSNPVLKEILSETAGIIIYQEQIMEIAQKMAGFSLGKADTMRKAMSKKSFIELSSLEEDFINGAIKKGFSQQLAEETYALILKFANYGFNKAHSVAYGLIAYQMAYLKANYPTEFFCALLNSVKSSSSKTKEYLDEAMLVEVHFLPLSVNKSEIDYKIENAKLRLPLTIIKNLGTVSSNQLIKARQELGDYLDFFDFVAKASLFKVNRKVIEALIDAGALNEFNSSKETLRQALNDALVYTNLITVIKDNNYKLDFSLVSKPELKNYDSLPLVDLEKEEEVLGFYLSNHPLVAIKHKLKYIGNNILEIKKKKDDIATLALVNKLKPYQTKTNEAMAFLTITDEVSEIEVVVLPKQYQKIANWIKEDELIYITGDIDKKGALVAQSIRRIVLKKEGKEDA